MDAGPVAEEARPWRREQDGARPQVATWPNTDLPALWVRSSAGWRYAQICARQIWADGSVYYQVEVDLRGDTTVTTTRLYWWPQPGLRMARASSVEPVCGVDETHQGDMPQRPPVRGGRTARP